MPAIIVFLDIDGTLIGLDQKPNADGLPSLIDDLRARGVRFGLNSNRAVEDVESVVRAFHLDGPFILENGAYVMNQINGERRLFPGVPSDIPDLVRRAMGHVVAREFPGATLEVGDTTAMVESGRETRDELHFFLNAYRLYSGSIHHRIDGRINPEIACRTADALNASFASDDIPLVATAHAHGGTVTVDIPSVDKGTALARVKREHADCLLVAVGDGSGDVALRPFVHRLYAVANAIPELRAIADAVSSEPMTAGVMEILRTHVRPLVEQKNRPCEPIRWRGTGYLPPFSRSGESRATFPWAGSWKPGWSAIRVRGERVGFPQCPPP